MLNIRMMASEWNAVWQCRLMEQDKSYPRKTRQDAWVIRIWRVWVCPKRMNSQEVNEKENQGGKWLTQISGKWLLNCVASCTCVSVVDPKDPPLIFMPSLVAVGQWYGQECAKATGFICFPNAVIPENFIQICPQLFSYHAHKQFSRHGCISFFIIKTNHFTTTIYP